jgi:hypothetical protein
MATKIAVGAAISLTVVALLSQRKKKKSRKAMA